MKGKSLCLSAAHPVAGSCSSCRRSGPALAARASSALPVLNLGRFHAGLASLKTSAPHISRLQVLVTSPTIPNMERSGAPDYGAERRKCHDDRRHAWARTLYDFGQARTGTVSQSRHGK